MFLHILLSSFWKGHEDGNGNDEKFGKKKFKIKFSTSF